MPADALTLRHRWWRSHYTLGGSTAAFVAAWLSMTPSLLPRTWLFQGLVAGASAAIGYGVGTGLGRLVKDVAPGWSRSASDGIWRALAGTALVGTAIALWAHARWTADLRALMGMPSQSDATVVLVVLVAPMVFLLLVAIGRVLVRAARALARLLGRVLPPNVSRALAVVAVAAVAVGLVNGVVVRSVMDGLNASFRTLNGETTAGTQAPTTPQLSGGPGSVVTWDGLGRKGRDFVAGGPTRQQISSFTGRPAVQPIRAYAGLESAATSRQRAALAVRELQRTGGFDRKVLVVITTTGTGWVDGGAVDPLEYMYDGDTAMVSMQYSFLPSWLSFLVDKARAKEAGRDLFDAVYGAWSALPDQSRPKLLVFGESLGSFGAEDAFSGLGDIANRTDGVLFVGPPNSSTLWTRFTTNRDPGTPEILPIYEAGATVRFAAVPTDLARPATGWTTPRMVYLQHASDPIVWWSPSLLFSEPDWLREPRGSDVLPSTRWFPVVTFLQISADMTVANSVPAGHGHHYGINQVDAWAAIAPPVGWTAADTARLRAQQDAPTPN